MEAKGTFTITFKPEDNTLGDPEGVTLGRMSFLKTFSGDLSAESCGEMLSTRTEVDTSAGYVAIEHVLGQLGGKEGSFVLQHFGIMENENDLLVLEVVPDSGTDELKGLSGDMQIKVEGKVHHYTFEYELA